MNRRKISAIIPAAGFSSRMGTFKPLLPLGEVTFLERLVGLFTAGGITDIRVVVGHQAADLQPFLQSLHVRPVYNPRYAEGMFSSVLAGAGTLEPAVEGFFVLPVDIPLVRRETIRRLIEAAESAGENRRIFYPELENHRGHPPLISTQLLPDLLQWHGKDGLRGFLDTCESLAREVPVADEFMLADMDTPEDYEALLKSGTGLDYRIPSPRECRAIMTRVHPVLEPVWHHCRAVARVASVLGQALCSASPATQVNPALIRAAALLHDIAKSAPDHARAGAEMLKKMGFPEVADIVGQHMDISVRPIGPPSEAEIVYLADKLVQGDQRVPLAERFDRKLEKYGKDPAARAAITRRRDNALTIRRRIETILKQSIEKIPDSDSDDLSAATR